MSALKSILSGIAQGLITALGNQTPRLPPEAGRSGAPRLKPRPQEQQSPSARPAASDPGAAEHGRAPGAETRRMDPRRMPTVRISYSPSRNGDPDAGEVIWTWVPYEEDDGRGKDRPVLVIGRQDADRVFAVRMTSKGRDGDIPIGSGAWDSKGRPSWVDIDQLYSVHVAGMRREAATLDRERYIVVASALIARYGWAVEK